MRRGAGVLIAVSLAACGEKLTAPGDCPGLCPSDNLVVVDTVIEARLDSTYTGFVEAGEGQRLLLSTGAAGGRRIGVARFTRREDSVSVRDTLFPYVVDSVVLGVTVQGRDRAATGLALGQPSDSTDTMTFGLALTGLSFTIVTAFVGARYARSGSTSPAR